MDAKVVETQAFEAIQACVEVGLRNEKIAVMRHRVLCHDRAEDHAQLRLLEHKMGIEELHLDMNLIAQITRRAVKFRLALVMLDKSAIQEICQLMSPTEEDILCRLLMEQVTQEMARSDATAMVRVHERAALLDIIYSITPCVQITNIIRSELFLMCVSLKLRVIDDMLLRMREDARCVKAYNEQATTRLSLS